MKKILLILMIFASLATYAQAEFPESVQLTNQASTTATKVNVQESNGVVNTIEKADLIEVLEYASAINLPVTGVAGKIYVTIDNGRLYRWNGTIYTEVSAGGVTSVSGLNGVTVTNPTTTPIIGLGDITPTTVTTNSTTLTPVTAPSYAEGKVFYDSTAKTLVAYDDISGTSTNLGQELNLRARNNTGGTIVNGAVVYISGATGQNPTIALARANSLSTSVTIGIATHDILNNTVGKITTFGLVNELNTSAFTDGQVLYLSPTTAGVLTSTVPSSPNYTAYVCVVLHSHVTQGKIFVRPEQPISLNTALTDNNNTSPSVSAVKSYADTKEALLNKQNSLAVDGTGVKYPTVDATIASLNLKANTISPTFSGNIRISENVLTNTSNRLRQNMADNDYWEIYGSDLGSDKGEMVLSVGDNGSDIAGIGQRFRFNFDNTNNGIAKNPLTINYNEIIADANLTAKKGTFTQTVGGEENLNLQSASTAVDAPFINFKNSSGTIIGKINNRGSLVSSASMFFPSTGDSFGRFGVMNTSFTNFYMYFDGRGAFGWGDGTATVADTGLRRKDPGTLEINNGIGGTLRDLVLRSINPSGRTLFGTVSDNGIDQIQVPNGTISALPATLSNQVVVKSQLDLKANIASPTFTGVPTVPTAAAGTNTTQIASTAFVSISFLPKASPIFIGEIFGSGNYVTESNFKLGATNTGLERYGSSGASFKEISNVWTSNVNLTAPSFIKTGGTSSQFLMADGSVSTASPPIQLKDFYSDVNNVGLTETDLLTYSTPASRLNAAGEKIISVYAGTMNDVTASSQLKAYFAGTLIADTGALTMSVTGAWVINASIIRTGATTARAIVNISTPGASTASYTKYTSLTGLTFTNNNIIKITGTASGATGGDNDITATYGNTLWQPAAL